MEHITKNKVKEKIKRLSNALVGYDKSLDDLYDLIEHHSDKIKYLETLKAGITFNIYDSVMKQQTTIAQIIEELKK